jgi:hypothetical protein
MKIEDIAEIDGDRATVSGYGTFKPKEAGKLLASFDGEIIFPNVERLEPEFYEALVKHNGKGISFPNMHGGQGIKLSVLDAQILSTYRGPLMFDFDSSCRLPGRLTYPLAPGASEKQEIEDEIAIAKAFKEHQGGELELQNICILSTVAAGELFAHHLPVYISSSFHASDEGACGSNPQWIREQGEAGSATEWDKIATMYREAEKRWFPDLPESEYPTRTRW